ncbi:hypothetical protein BS47DRAFT_1401043 [Hydnum rufescens UP504]|uniref:Uncharacterized protein n=1 Tax=Hydnum rufescens UP504 TaxID=1448309 RepID=A0A9P6AFA6_9AGAM|nr:hypothetical protein BS47DRAFT_1401043 [Hydnum rufescens UP504]
MPKPSYFALVGIETLTLQELLACWARRNGLSPMDWTNPLEPEPPPSSGPSPLLNSDTTELTLVECVRTPLTSPYRTVHGSNSASSSSLHTPPDANIRDSNVGKSASRSSTAQPLMSSSTYRDRLPNPLPCRVDTSRWVATPLKKCDASIALPSLKDQSLGTPVSKQAHRPLIDGTLSPLSNRVDTSRRVATPLKNHIIRTSLERDNKYSPSRAVKIISTWLDWLLYDLDVDSTDFLSWVVYDSCVEPVCYKLDPALAHTIWQCKVILWETVQETPLFCEATPSAHYEPRPHDLERASLVVGLPSLGLLQLAVSQAKHLALGHL